MPTRVLPSPPSPMLFNLAHDPYEQNDLATQEPVRVAKLVQQLETWFETVEADRKAIAD